MKKVLLLLLLFIVACGGSNEETSVQDTTTTTIQDTTTTTIQDTTTTTIPPAPRVDFNIVEIYNTKLGTDLCSDAKEIDTTSETCLKEYRDNLENVFSYADNLEKYITELNAYLESYPSAMKDEYTKLFEFINSEYKDVPETYELIASKYIQRFGGVPVLNDIFFDPNSIISAGCTVSGGFNTQENLYSAVLNYRNDIGQNFQFKINEKNKSFNLSLYTQGGQFTFHSGTAINYLGEEYEIVDFSSSFFVNHLFTRIVDVIFPNNPVSIGETFEVKVIFDPIEKVEDGSIVFWENATSGGGTDYLSMNSSVVDGNQITFYGIFVDDIGKVDWSKTSYGPDSPTEVYFYPGQSTYEISRITLPIRSIRSQAKLLNTKGIGLNLPGECGAIDTLKLGNAFTFSKKILLVNR